MWRIFAILTAITTTVGCLVVENPQEEMQAISSYVIRAYEYSKNRIEENPSQAATIGTPIVTSIGWILAYIFLFRNTKTFKSYEEYKDYISKQSKARNPSPEKKESVTEAPTTTNRAQARILYSQLKQDLSIAEGRAKWLPEEISTAQMALGDACHERNVAHNTLAQKESKVKAAEIRLDKLSKELEESDSDIKNINAELKRLQDII